MCTPAEPQQIGSDWLGVDVNIAARVMERATRGGLVVSQTTLERISDEDFECVGRLGETDSPAGVYEQSQDGVPADLTMYCLKARTQAVVAPEHGRPWPSVVIVTATTL